MTSVNIPPLHGAFYPIRYEEESGFFDMTARKILTRDFTLCFLAQFVFSSVFFILIPTIPIYLSRLGVTKAGIGILVGALSVSSLMLRPLVGRALSKIPERNFMIAGSLLYAFSSMGYLIAKPFWPFFIVRIFQGIGLALFATASFTLVARISPEAHRGQSLGYFYLAINIAFALAPSLGIAIINLLDFNILFLICAGLSLCALFIAMRLGKQESIPPEESAEKQPLLSRETLPPAIMAFMGSFIWGAITAFISLYALHHGVANPGPFFTALAVTLILGRGLGGKILDIYSREKVLFPCLAAQIIAMTILAFSTTLPMFILVAIIWGTGNAFFYPTLVAYAIDLAESSKGSAIGTYMALSDFGTGMGAVMMGIVLQLSNYPIMFLCLALTATINLYYFYSFTRRRKSQLANP
ncbi:MAG: MFS transporter [Thermodesulfobacteriota bacterium]|nr:MFS transporter [Thermodesulfobacteriota bacterium]